MTEILFARLDDITALLSSNNIWTGTNTFNSANTWTGVNLILAPGRLTAGTSTAGDPTKMWYPTYFSNSATGVVTRLNRLFVGVAINASSDIPLSVTTWVDDYITNWNSLSQFSSTSAVGGLAVSGAARTSDYRAWSGLTSGGSQASSFFAVNDDTTPATTPIACGVCGGVLHLAGVNGISVNQFDASNQGASIVSTPYAQVNSGSTWSALITNGGGTEATGAAGTTNITAYIGMGRSSLTAPKANKGIIFFNDALEPSIGSGGNGVAIEMARGQDIRWLNSLGGVDGVTFADGNGLVLNVPAGKTITAKVASTDITYTNDATFTAAANNTFQLGLSSLRWSNVWSVLGNFSGAVSLNGSSSGVVALNVQAAAGTYNFNLPTTAGTSGQLLTSGGGSASPMTWTTFSSLSANPSASIGLSAVNGSASTYMRSDAAPSLSQAIVPTWTGLHTWNASSGNPTAAFLYGTVGTPLPTDPSFGYIAVTATVYASQAGGSTDPSTVALVGNAHLSAGTRGNAVGVLGQAYNDGTWGVGTSTNAGGIGVQGTWTGTNGGALGFGANFVANCTTVACGQVAGTEIDTNNTVNGTAIKFGLAIVDSNSSVGTITGTYSIATGGTTPSNTAILVQVSSGGLTAYGFDNLITTIKQTGGAQPVRTTGSLWRSGGFTTTAGLNWSDTTFTGNAIDVNVFKVAGTGVTTIAPTSNTDGLIINNTAASNYAGVQLNGAATGGAAIHLARAGTNQAQLIIDASDTYLDYQGALNVRSGISGPTRLSLSAAGAVAITGAVSAAAVAIPAGGTAGVGYTFSSTANYGVFFGSGAPSLAAAKGSLYLRSDGSGTGDRAYINTNGSTTWTALTTAA